MEKLIVMSRTKALNMMKRLRKYKKNSLQHGLNYKDFGLNSSNIKVILEKSHTSR